MWFELESGSYVNLDNVAEINKFFYLVIGDKNPHRWTEKDYRHCLNAIKRKGRLAAYNKEKK